MGIVNLILLIIKQRLNIGSKEVYNFICYKNRFRKQIARFKGKVKEDLGFFTKIPFNVVQVLVLHIRLT